MRTQLMTLASCIAMALSSAAIAAPSATQIKTNQFWWPEQLDLSPLRQHDINSNPYGKDFDYRAEFVKLDLAQVKADIEKTLTDSQDWWPADWGHYGPLMIRMAWHSAGVYRVHDGRGGAAGGQQRFNPLNSWPDNANLDKARRLLWPVKQKYGKQLSWADLMVLAGNVSLESMGFKTFGFAGGRSDDWEPDLVYWGPETTFLADKRRDKKGKLKGPLAAVEMGLIYVNPEGPHGKPDPLLAADDIRLSFGRMAMNDEEIVALIAGGHTFGKAHGAKKPSNCIGKEPAAAPTEQQGFGWKNKCGTGKGADTSTSGLEGAWTVTPTRWSTNYLDNLMNFNWVQTKSPAGAIQWIPDNPAAANLVPDAHIKGKRSAPIMFTTDLALKEDPAFRKIVERFRADPREYELAFAKAWFKLTHRDMGPRARYLGNEVPSEVLTWQDPIPEHSGKKITQSDIKTLQIAIKRTGLSNADLIETAWAAASSHRVTDMRGGANGARIRLAPQNNWAVNNPRQLKQVLAKLEQVKTQFNKRSKRQVSLSDVIVLAGKTGIEAAFRNANMPKTVPFSPGRTDASQAQTDVKSFSFLEPKADAFRNYYHDSAFMSPTKMLIDKANMLGLSVPEMTVLLGGMRVLETNTDNSHTGVLTHTPGSLDNAFFVNLLDMRTQWKKSDTQPGMYLGYDRKTGQQQWKASAVDLIFGSNSELRAIAEVYASDDAKQKFADDFIKVWVKVMRLDRFDLM
ncbi:catalase/peroxidase HPI [Pseudoalteromonas luteoviolacea]|uniref:Catalase-peroxidase n=1 Tax=Pseudoalteromonas luteoviolacea S4054 TaxID=1129367 RepID=A0A0F6ABS7_9GAMM|nr:catalase/peroxidase HPI [Pseudoalteromonas luteoviolacea]AOT08834.1 peroxidase [Pseudoalteromonas luteoviolacea]AOT13747.1 peroxidase [Pseudoalteromonas luteoviolacea]AOT18661.1 peroxidase [Pseudoalteromonas luteoviolacea]KKE83603.1 catalase-peroxidase [Pseudoalteromonas luteoviolacea S4054]KZN72792.1 catalase-peroxidase [Pseudoalteromonas luteoviolacea S4047-1]